MTTPTTDELDAARAALETERAGGKLTRTRQRALTKWRKQIATNTRAENYWRVPTAEFRKLAGFTSRQAAHNMADRFGFPFTGTHVDLGQLLPAMIGWIQRHHREVEALKTDDPLLVGDPSDALESYRTEKFLLARLDRLERQGQLIPLTDMNEWLDRLSGRLRAYGERVQRDQPPAAFALYQKLVDEFEAEILRWLAGRDAGLDPSPTGPVKKGGEK